MKRYKFCAALAALGLVAALDAAVFAGVSSAAAPAGVVSASAAKSSSGQVAIKAPAAPAGAFISRPTMSLAEYKAIKAAAASLATRPGVKAPASPNKVTLKGGFNGINQAGTAGFFPSDSNGAIGGSVIAETVNSNLISYTAAGVQKSSTTLNALAGYSTQSLFDPRVIYDSKFKRWIVTADAFAESATVQFEFIMVSKSSNAGGAYWVYAVNALGFCGGSSPFWDYPQTGQTQDAVVFTGNCFNSAGEQPDTFAVAKAVLYNGLGFSVPVFGFPGTGTATPANVYDNRPANYLITTNQHMIGFQDPQAGFYASISSNNAITGFEPFAVPRSAGQAGCTTTSCQLDTGDGRFVNDSSQFGDQLWNVASYGLGGSAGNFATPYWGQFSIAGHSTTQFGDVFLNSCSDDWNASLVAGTDDKVWLNWSATDPQGSSCGQTFAQQMSAGRTSATTSGGVDNILDVFGSAAELTGNFDSNFGLQRWGDTSSVGLQNATTAFAVNNSVVNSSTWGTRWAKLTQ